jgi:hypothetical protein
LSSTNSNAQISAKTSSSGAVRTSGRSNDGSCSKNEIALFQCNANNKIISICGVREPSPHGRYHLTKGGSLDFVYPVKNGKLPPIKWARMGYSGGGEIQYSFFNEGYQYIVYSKIIRKGFDSKRRPLHDFIAGVHVRKDGITKSQLRCDNPEEAAKNENDPSHFMEQGDFVFLDD